jgi:hypothetical protein
LILLREFNDTIGFSWLNSKVSPKTGGGHMPVPCFLP